jgi:hypothetical protein
MVITGYSFVIYLKKIYLNSGVDAIHIEINNMLNGF